MTKLIQEQQVLAKKLVTTDAIEENNLIAGATSLYSYDNIISTIIIYDKKQDKVIEKKFSIDKVKQPYHKDFICYRECPNLIKTFQLLKNKPSVIFVEGDGIAHIRRMGVASYFGLFVDIPTIGINQTQTFGMIEGDALYHEKEIIAKILFTKEKAKPIYISPGYRISLTTAIELTKQFLVGHKLPEPLHLAHKYATKIKNRFQLTVSKDLTK